jgi:hypothetical protein
MGVAKELSLGKRKFKGGKNDYSKPDQPAFRFINIELTKEQKSDLKALVETGEFGYSALHDLHGNGFKVTLSSSDDGKRYTCSITDKSPNSAFWNACITASGSTPLNAVNALLYKHYVVANEDWANISVEDLSEYD